MDNPRKKMRRLQTKTFKQIIGSICMLAIVVGMLPMNGAAAVSSGRTVTVSNPYSSMSFVGNSGDSIVDNYSNVPSSDTGKVLSIGTTFSYTRNDRIDTYYVGRVFPITVSARGTLHWKAICTYMGADEQTYVRICSNADGTSSLGSIGIDVAGVAEDAWVEIPNAGTYYLVCMTWNTQSSGKAFTNTFDVDVTFAPTQDLQLNANAWYSVGRPSYSQDVYYRVVLNSASYLTLYTDDELSYDITDSRKSKIRTSIYNAVENTYQTSTYLKAGTYYIRVNYAYAKDGNYKIKYTASGHKTLKNKTWTNIYPSKMSEEVYLAVKPTVDGYITINIYGGEGYDTSVDVTLCNASFKEVSDSEYVCTTWDDSNKAVFGVKKNTKYYLKVTGVSTAGRIKYTQTQVKEKSGTKKTKAVEIKRNKKIQGTIAAADKKADWYKIKVTKTGKVKLFTTGNASGYIYMQLYYSNGDKLGYYVTLASKMYASDKWTSTTKLKKGTYYIKIYRGNNTTTGNYTLKWK